MYNKYKDKIKKYIYPISFVCLLLLISTLTSKTKIFNKSSETVPLIPNNSETFQKDKESEITRNITPATNLTPTDFGEARITNNSIIIGEKTIKIDDKINSFRVFDNLMIIEGGNIYGKNKEYYWHNIQTNAGEKINTDKLRHVVSYTVDTVTNKVYFLGNYDSKQDKSNLYEYDTVSKTFKLLESQVEVNKLEMTGVDTLALISEKHGPEINVKTKLYKASEKRYVTPEISTGENLYCINSIQMVSYNLRTKLFTQTNLSDYTQKNTTSGLVTDEMHLLCNEENYFLIEKQEDKTVFNNLGPTFNLISKKEAKNTTQKTYIQSFVQGGKLINKYLDKNKDLYYLSQD